MARIIYGVAGEGSGHSSRAKVIIEHLLSKGHEVKIVSHDAGYNNLSQFFPVEKITGLKLVYKNNSVKYLTTVFNNVIKLPQRGLSARHLMRLWKDFRPQICFSDFEPLTALVAKLYRTPLVSVDNQHILTNTKVNFPKKYHKDALVTKEIIRYMVPRPDTALITTFFFPPLKDKKTFLFPPILRNEVLTITPFAQREEDFILVYSTSAFKGLLSILNIIPYKFVVYGFNEVGDFGPKIVFKPNNSTVFLADLAMARGVIATAGFSLISEALYLGKPYLAVPVRQQFEQILNAYQLEKTGYGKYCEIFDRESVNIFLNNLSLYNKRLQTYPREGNKKILEKIDSLIKTYAQRN